MGAFSCDGCKNKKPGCHGTCITYTSYILAYLGEKSAKEAFNARDNEYLSYVTRNRKWGQASS